MRIVRLSGLHFGGHDVDIARNLVGIESGILTIAVREWLGEDWVTRETASVQAWRPAPRHRWGLA